MDQQSDKMRLNADLLGYHLGLLDEENRAKLEAAFPDKASLEAACRSVANCLRPLDADETPMPPANLAAGIMARVGAAQKTIPFPTQHADSAKAVAQRPSRSMMRIRELVGMAAAIALFAGVFVPGYHTSRRAEGQRANVTSWQDGFGSHSSPSFQLVNGNYATPSNIVCPGKGNAATPYGGAAPTWHNAYAPYVLVSPLEEGDLVAGAADKGRSVSSESTEMRRRVAPRSTWTVRLRANVHPVRPLNDDIYRLIGNPDYTGFERPAQRSDACLVP